MFVCARIPLSSKRSSYGTAKITREDVITYLKRLPVDQSIPTMRDIRADLGGGSLATISAGVNAYLEERACAPAIEHAIPHAFEQSGRDLLVKLWGIAAKEIAESEALAKRNFKARSKLFGKIPRLCKRKSKNLRKPSAKRTTGRQR